MKIRADEHVSPKILQVLQILVLPADWEMSHVRQHHSERTADETWIPRFVLEGGKVIFSADRNIVHRPHQLKAIADGGLIGIFMSGKWAQSKRHIQASNILWWWPKIHATILAASPGECWRVPFAFGDTGLDAMKIPKAAAPAVSEGRK